MHFAVNLLANDVSHSDELKADLVAKLSRPKKNSPNASFKPGWQVFAVALYK